jgi:hypothetical protein
MKGIYFFKRGWNITTLFFTLYIFELFEFLKYVHVIVCTFMKTSQHTFHYIFLFSSCVIEL